MIKLNPIQLSLDKTMVMYHPAPTNLYHDPEILLDNNKLKNVDRFK